MSQSPLGQRLEALRESRNLTQEQLAKLAGLHQTAISGIENGRSVEPRRSTLEKIAKALELGDTELEELRMLRAGLQPEGNRPASDSSTGA